jgi:hypothetical protein
VRYFCRLTASGEESSRGERAETATLAAMTASADIELIRCVLRMDDAVNSVMRKTDRVASFCTQSFSAVG